MKKLLAKKVKIGTLVMTVGIFALITFAPLRLFAQNDLSGIYVDNIKTDSITCWSFEKMNFVFPFNEKFKNYDKINLEMHLMNNEDYEEAAFHVSFSQTTLNDIFGNAKYGVWKIFRDKKTDKLQSNIYTYEGWTYYGRYKFHYCKFPEKKYRLVFVVRGFKEEGFTIAANGEKLVKYGTSFELCKPITIPVKRWIRSYEVDEYETVTVKKMGFETKKKVKRNQVDIDKEKAGMLDYDENAPCKIPGIPVELKIEEVGGYREDLGLIK